MLSYTWREGYFWYFIFLQKDCLPWSAVAVAVEEEEEEEEEDDDDDDDDEGEMDATQQATVT